MSRFKYWGSNFSTNFNSIPALVKAFLIFSFSITVYQILGITILPKSIIESTLPFTGSLTVPYLFISFTLPSIFITNWTSQSKETDGNMKFWYWNSIFILIIGICFGIYDLNTWKGGYEDNPYLYRHPLRYIWTIIIPSIWFIILLTLKIRDKI
jgi:hypothetical protein